MAKNDFSPLLILLVVLAGIALVEYNTTYEIYFHIPETNFTVIHVNVTVNNTNQSSNNITFQNTSNITVNTNKVMECWYIHKFTVSEKDYYSCIKDNVYESECVNDKYKSLTSCEARVKDITINEAPSFLSVYGLPLSVAFLLLLLMFYVLVRRK